MISGLTISDFGDLAHDYRSNLERKSNSVDSVDLQNSSKSLVERKYADEPTSAGGVSKRTINRRRDYLKEERQQYQNRAACQHREAMPQRIKNPFAKACGRNLPLAGDFLSQADL